MCGRIALYADTGRIAELFQLPEESVPDHQPHYNIAPGHSVLAAYKPDRMATVTWGIDMQRGERLLSNARSETAHSKPTFSKSFQKYRCLIPANGFYEWQKRSSGPKQPMWIAPEDGQPFALAGIIVLKPQPALVIMTTNPNRLVGPIHNRMPVIVNPDDFPDWFAADCRSPAIRKITAPREWPGFSATPVSRLVNQPANNDARLIAAA